MDKWYDELQISLMYVCARTLVINNPKLALKMATFHLSLFSDTSVVPIPVYISGQKFYKVKEMVERNVHPAPVKNIKEIKEMARNRYNFFELEWENYQLDQEKLTQAGLNFTLMRNHFDTLKGQFENSQKITNRLIESITNTSKAQMKAIFQRKYVGE